MVCGPLQNRIKEVNLPEIMCYYISAVILWIKDKTLISKVDNVV